MPRSIEPAPESYGDGDVARVDSGHAIEHRLAHVDGEWASCFARFSGAFAQDLKYKPRQLVDSSGFTGVLDILPRWKPDSTLEEIGRIWQGIGHQGIARIDEILLNPAISNGDRVQLLVKKATLLNYEAEPRALTRFSGKCDRWSRATTVLRRDGLYTVIFLQGVTALRRGETDNCVMCRGESSCILPISQAAVHTNPAGSRQAIGHFTEYLEEFPDDQGCSLAA